MGIWGDRLLPHVIDKAGDTAELRRLRAEVCAGLHGTVLEVGFGSGLNVPHYPAAVTEVLAVEPSEVAWALSEARRAASKVPVRRSGLDGQRLTEADGTADCVLSTLTLCTIPDVGAALAELRRVLRPGGTLHFFEHGRSPDPGVERWQHRLDPLQGALFGGCHLSRDMPALVREAGFSVDRLEEAYLPGPRVSRPWTYGYLARATR
ncbi:class I SAM-dependent methyltransferase [Nocardioides guangzhouensis]|uniref:Class I SAM-dependent methyltransferase n=1 Tax=Nocardioides guangzhouensis TaxID=2497878 RepID=A0A4Q4Z847_9ACTN|nr:class I SAM-dependent methyltransferase [Nocardioides guangzhouensis]RYP83605.1 class I SAM-dependent methyltransferase [Nocardioides guangzhouensis]